MTRHTARYASGTAVVTGGTSGIGLALAERLHREGAPLIVIARNPDSLARLERDLPGIRTYACDLAIGREVDETARRLRADHPEISLLVNNAGIQQVGSLRSPAFDAASIDRETAVNFLAPVHLTRLLLPALEHGASGATIVNVTSGLAFAPKRDAAVYCATKAALRNFSQGLRLDLQGTGIRVVEAILPLVDTAMTAGRGTGKLAPAVVAEAILKGVREGRQEIYVGKARWLPLVARLSPKILRSLMARL